MVHLVILYLSINCILSIVAMVVVDRADEYWRRGEDAPTNLLTLSIIGTVLWISKIIATVIGYGIGFYNGLFNIGHTKKTSKFTLRLMWLLTGIFKVLLFLPLFIYILISESSYKYKGDI